MPVTKQVYSIPATWTAVQLADAFGSAFIDAGLMSNWHAAFTSGSTVNRVLKITYSAGKTYGDCYYWFQFTTTAFGFQAVTGWNTSTNVPTGTQYFDWYSNTTSSLSGRQLNSSSYSTTTNAELVRYTSQSNNTHSIFAFKQSTTQNTVFLIGHPSHQVASWIDLDKASFSHLLMPITGVSNSSAFLAFNSLFALRRAYGVGAGVVSFYGLDTNICTASYCIPGRTTSISLNMPIGANWNYGSVSGFSLMMPNAIVANNPAYGNNYNPIVTGVPYSFYMTNSQLPPDIGIIPTYANNTLGVGDTFVVSPGVEEWEILFRSNNGAVSTSASIALGVRMI